VLFPCGAQVRAAGGREPRGGGAKGLGPQWAPPPGALAKVQGSAAGVNAAWLLNSELEVKNGGKNRS